MIKLVLYSIWKQIFEQVFKKKKINELFSKNLSISQYSMMSDHFKSQGGKCYKFIVVSRLIS